MLDAKNKLSALIKQVEGCMGGAVVPALWRLEVGNVLVVAQRRGRMTVTDRVQALVTLGDLPIVVLPAGL